MKKKYTIIGCLVGMLVMFLMIYASGPIPDHRCDELAVDIFFEFIAAIVGGAIGGIFSI